MRTAFLVYVNTDPPESEAPDHLEEKRLSAKCELQNLLNAQVKHYDPNVLFAPRDLQPGDRSDYEGNN